MPAGRIRPKHWPLGTLPTIVVLWINILTSIGGVAFPNTLLVRQVVYILLLVFCFIFLLSYLFMKHCFLAVTHNIKPCCANKCKCEKLRESAQCVGNGCCNWSVVHDVVFCTMAMLYLSGDNLEMSCTQRYCPIAARALTGASLVLNFFIQGMKLIGLVPNLPAAFPVIGIMGNVYNSMMQLAAQSLTIDQAVTTILESVDIAVAANDSINGNRFTLQGTTLIVNIAQAQIAASGFTAAIFGCVLIGMFIFLVRLAYVNKEVCCNCKHKEVTHCERFGQLVCGILVMAFVILFVAGDIDWVWKFFQMEPVSQPGVIIRLTFLSASLVLLCMVMLVYILVLCIPGACFVWNDRHFFLSKHGGMTVEGHMKREKYNEWNYKDKKPPEVTCSHAQLDDKKCELNGKMTVEEYFGKADVTLSIDEHDKIKCWDGFCSWINCRYDSVAENPLNLEATISRGRAGGVVNNNTPTNGVSPKNGEDSGGGSSPTNWIPLQEVDGSIRDTTGKNLGN